MKLRFKQILGAVTVFYSPRYPKTIVYMLQASEYHEVAYLKWFWRTPNFRSVAVRRDLVKTKAAKLLNLALSIGMIFEIVFGLSLIYAWHYHGFGGGLYYGIAVILATPIAWAHLIMVPLLAGRYLIVNPTEKRLVTESEVIFRKHKGIKLAIAGSYGKTSMKELLLTVLSEGKRVAATPGNKNVPISHARFAKTLDGNEEIILLEYGEGAPGDVARFAQTTHPTHGVITGLAPAHLDQYKTLEAAGEDIFSLAGYLKGKHVYVNAESPSTKPFLQPSFNLYDQSGALGWKVSQVKVDLSGTKFKLTKGAKELNLHSGLIGHHQLGPLSLVAGLAHEFGLDDQAIIKGVKATKPFEHRMQPYLLAGAWVIDDTYNGNLEGIRVGTQLLAELQAKRKIYITPGLVDQGAENEKVHFEIGQLIATSKPGLVVLMDNSVTGFIKKGLVEGGYVGELRIEPNPLGFYNNLSEFVAVGDLVLMQNDWPDNYA
ncbi:MAG TPA: Mur ligase family protein [Candidatus Binatia bacterium]|nr:Mur ligase family protein [Candidatus Binatia bacterium]